MKQKVWSWVRRIAAAAVVASIFALVMPASIGSADTVTATATVAPYLGYAVDTDCLTGGVQSGAVAFGTVTPGTPVSKCIEVTVDTNSAIGYNITASETTAACTSNPTLCHSDTTTDLPDHGTDFIDVTSCVVGTYAVWGATVGLGATVFLADTNKDTTCYGAGTTYDDALNEYGAFTTAAKKLHNTTSGPLADDDTQVAFKVNVATTQKSGSYSGTTVFTATQN